MSFYPQKQEDTNPFLQQNDQEQLENLRQNDKSPEFDEIGTPLNAL
ncbi:hypothetical protein [Neobacillus jeddahensis]|nr:hypothetical protein [Neobacillus jeddahensis]